MTVQGDIVVEGLVKHYGSLTAVNGISFSVHKGEVFGILGPNGAGKTTTFEYIEGLLQPAPGQAQVHGLATQQESLRVK